MKRLLFGLLLVAPAWTQVLHWANRPTAVAPSRRYSHAMVYDAARRQVVLFGGWDYLVARESAETWVWDGTQWMQRFPVHSPSARSQHAMVDDDALGKVILFGGYGNYTSLNDTWSWDGTDWQPVTTAHQPPAQSYNPPMAYDAGRHQVVLLDTRQNVTWLFDGNDWTSVSAGTGYFGPNAAITYDPARQLVFLFGGGHDTFSNTVWSWNGATWQVVPSFTSPPSARSLLQGVYNGAVMLVFGGRSVGPGPQPSQVDVADTWGWNYGEWIQYSQFANPAPSPRDAYGMASDAAHGEIVLFGGENPFNGQGAFGDTWVLTSYNGCSYTVTPDAEYVPSTGGLGMISILPSDSTCSWSITNAPSWLTLSVSGGVGLGSVSYSVQPNMSATARTASLSVAGQSVSIRQNEWLTSYFDDFSTLSQWREDVSCVVGPREQGTKFCPGHVQASPGLVTLKGDVSGGVREGAELDWRQDNYALPPEGTFAARVRFVSKNVAKSTHAPIKAFFTYRSLPSICAHMEHDFEVLTGTSSLYTQQTWVSDSDIKKLQPGQPLMTNVTHLHPPECRNLQQTDPNPKKGPVAQASDLTRLIGASSDEFITLVLTVHCTVNCASTQERTYTAEYSVVSGSLHKTLLTTKDDAHSALVNRIDPTFNLWWLDPKASLLDAAEESLEVSWFYWNSAILLPQDADGRGQSCKDRHVAAGPGRCP